MASRAQGFSLVELVIVMTITGILAAVVARFVVRPVDGYMDSVARADLSDSADGALRRMARDLRLALPNSVRMTASGAVRSIEFLSTRTGGRYRAALGAGAEDILDFNDPGDTTFDILGPATDMKAGDQIVIYNLGIDGADAYAGNTGATHNRRAYRGVAGSVTTIGIASSEAFPFESPSSRFHVVDTPVSYVCDLAAGTLRRFWGYPIVAAQAAVPAGGNNALLAQNLTACEFSYQPGGIQRTGAVTMRLSLTRNGETVSLYHEVHVNNVP